jgi:hypothetical protein
MKTKQKTSGGISVRANGNFIAHNLLFDNEGAGIRLGGDTKNYGIENEILYNFLSDNEKAGLKIMRTPQKRMCGNAAQKEKKLYYPKNKRFKGAFEPCHK